MKQEGEFNNTQEFYIFVDLLIAKLTESPFSEDGKQLYFLLHKVAWTTGSELIGEIGIKLIKIQDRNPPSDLKHDISKALSYIKKIWPDIDNLR